MQYLKSILLSEMDKKYGKGEYVINSSFIADNEEMEKYQELFKKYLNIPNNENVYILCKTSVKILKTDEEFVNYYFGFNDKIKPNIEFIENLGTKQCLKSATGIHVSNTFFTFTIIQVDLRTSIIVDKL